MTADDLTDRVIESDVILADLDDTLYQNKPFHTALSRRTREWLQTELNLDDDEIDERFVELQDTYPNVYEAIDAFSLSINAYHETVFHSVNPAEYLQRDQELADRIDSLRNEFIVITFAPPEYSRQVLRAIGIDDMVADIYTVCDDSPTNEKKPLYTEFEDTGCLVIGDNYDMDLKPAEELGIPTVHVASDCRVRGDHACYRTVHDVLRLLE